MSRQSIVLTVALLLIFATVALMPAASAERVTGCADGWDQGDADCFLGDHPVPDPQCVAGVRECGPPS